MREGGREGGGGQRRCERGEERKWSERGREGGGAEEA